MPAHHTRHASAQQGTGIAQPPPWARPHHPPPQRLPKTLSRQAVHFAVWLKDRTSTRILGDATPYERRHEKPSLAGRHEWEQCVYRSFESIFFVVLRMYRRAARSNNKGRRESERGVQLCVRCVKRMGDSPKAILRVKGEPMTRRLWCWNWLRPARTGAVQVAAKGSGGPGESERAGRECVASFVEGEEKGKGGKCCYCHALIQRRHPLSLR
jgi:hypothetical protein